MTVDITNTGTKAGKEVVQIYTAAKSGKIIRPKKELKEFKKTALEPGETKTLEFFLDSRSFSYYDTSLHDWCTEEGTYRILAGASSRDIRCETSVYRKGTSAPATLLPDSYLEKGPDGKPVFSTERFAEALGHPVPPVRPAKPFTGNSSIAELSESGMGKLIRKGIAFAKTRLSGKGVSEDMILEAPIRMVFWVSSRVTWDTVDAIADVFNGKSTVFKVYGTMRKKSSGR